jgi:drug/metabolite transporter (DMT)-like permease
LFPIVAVIGGALLLDEPITSPLLIGAPVVLVGVYVGALSGRREPAAGSRAPSIADV